MTGDKIPLVTVISSSKNKITTFKRPKYVLKTAEEIKIKQDKLGENIGWYYGSNCEKCCGVYPAFFTDDGLNNYCYYVCLVCGKESEHMPMPFEAAKAWNKGKYIYIPDHIYKQLTIFDL